MESLRESLARAKKHLDRLGRERGHVVITKPPAGPLQIHAELVRLTPAELKSLKNALKAHKMAVSNALKLLGE